MCVCVNAVCVCAVFCSQKGGGGRGGVFFFFDRHFTPLHPTLTLLPTPTPHPSTTPSGILQNLDYSLVECQALVLAPTRELAQQIEKVMRALGDYLQVKCHACVGGTSVREDTRILQGGVHVVVGTPGRVYDMLRRRALRADSIKMFVLDEADEMLSRGFKDQIYDIFQLLPPKLQVGVFSATLPPEALEITRKFMNKPVRILVKRDELTLEGIKQFYVNVEVWRGGREGERMDE